MNVNFIDRPACELCCSTQVRCLLSRPMTDASVWDFLSAYYEGRISRSLLDGVAYVVRLCMECGFAWQGHVLVPALMTRLYGEWISAEASLDKKRRGDAALFEAYAAQARRIAQLVGKPPERTEVLDFGMGWGYWCRTAQSLGYRVAGHETEPARVSHAQGMGVRTIAELRRVADGAFDFVNAEQVFEHIAEPLQSARELCRLLRPGGMARISVPNAEKLLHELDRPDWKAAKDALHPLEHINAFTHATLVRLGSTAGLVCIGSAVAPGGWRQELRSLLRRVGTPGTGDGTALLFRKPAR